MIVSILLAALALLSFLDPLSSQDSSSGTQFPSFPSGAGTKCSGSGCQVTGSAASSGTPGSQNGFSPADTANSIRRIQEGMGANINNLFGPAPAAVSVQRPQPSPSGGEVPRVIQITDQGSGNRSPTVASASTTSAGFLLLTFAFFACLL
ncbi:uncharacterized protein LOC129597425 [Paramacrobiotus metropolitanus]|uniref:uncharacterized protein LOC129597425 n=1 Tax=Paramacrobiotus metropolitanus TaxID=2943436 RepID=UPI002445AD3A|nr:uncharacterized protein LOC129597425 [Paramacrobiotus metropolitanus]XP_055350937.1 uncharacterized protein LOC129597425 [Paramacrobiotus metropolitanus]